MRRKFTSSINGAAAAAASLLVLAAACSDSQMPMAFCTAPASLAVEVTVTDSVSGLPLAEGASGLLHNNARTDTLFRQENSPLILLGGSHLGTYTLDLSRSGYAGWHKDGILVSKTGVCGNVIPVQLQARLQPVP